MKFSIPTLAAAFIGLAGAAPAPQPRAHGVDDLTILNYALTLENLENAFYREGLAKFGLDDFEAAGYDSTFYENLQQVSADEATHVEFISGAILAVDGKPVKECKYKFPMTDVNTFLATASVLEGVGVSAYLGAAASIMNKLYLTAAGSILTVEARHSSYLRAGLDQVPFAQPFDNPLTLNEVYTLAAQFIVSCPRGNPTLPVKAFPALTATSNDDVVTTGSCITLHSTQHLNPHGATVWGAFITVLGPKFVAAEKTYDGYKVTVPKGVYGQSYVVLNKGRKTVSDDTVLAGPAIVEVTQT